MKKSEWLAAIGIALTLILGQPYSAKSTSVNISVPLKNTLINKLSNESGDKIVTSDKIWTINFKQDVDVSTIIDNIYIASDEKGYNKLNITIQPNFNNLKQIKILPPKSGYSLGEYYLFINRNLASSKKVKLSRDIKIKFIVQDNIKSDNSSKKLGAVNDGFVSFSNPNNGQSDYDFPDRFDLRVQNILSPIRDQGSDGNCWAFAAYGSLESTEKKLYNINADYSEQNLKNYGGNLFDFGNNNGGNRLMATAYLASGFGPILESDDPYNPKDTNLKPLKQKFEVINVDFIPDKDTSALKKAILQNGAVYSSLYWNDKYYNAPTNSYYNNIQSIILNHAIDIVGWDDNYDRDNFSIIPQHDGAWICRNSWNSSWGDKGYFYVSYDDKGIARQNALFEPSNVKFDNIHEYDPLGYTTSINYNSSSIWFANKFKIGDKEEIQAVSFFTNTENTNYNIYVISDNLNSLNDLSNISSNQVTSGLIDEPGYHTVIFDDNTISKINVLLQKSRNVVIAVKLFLPKNITQASIPIEDLIPKYSSKACSDVNQSFISEDGITWRDLHDSRNNANVCLKLFTNNVTEPTKPIVDKTVLLSTLKIANQLYNSAVEGNGINQYAVGSKIILKQEINNAQKLYDDFNATQDQVNTENIKLVSSIDTFKTKIIAKISIANIQDLSYKIKVNDNFKLPNTVEAIMTDGTEQQVLIQWDNSNVDTSKPKTILFTGTVSNYKGIVKLTLEIVEPLKPSNADNSILINTIKIANQLYNYAVEGKDIGQYIIGSKAILKQEIDKAQNLCDNISSDQSQIDIENEQLNEAMNTFRKSKVTSIYITNIDDVFLTINQNDKYELPALVTAAMSNGTTKQIPISWDVPPSYWDTSKPGTSVYSGNVNGYKKEVMITITINKVLQIVSIPNLLCKVKVNDKFTLPKTVEAIMEDGTKQQFPVEWQVNPIIDTSQPKDLVYTGYVPKCDLGGNFKLMYLTVMIR